MYIWVCSCVLYLDVHVLYIWVCRCVRVSMSVFASVPDCGHVTARACACARVHVRVRVRVSVSVSVSVCTCGDCVRLGVCACPCPCARVRVHVSVSVCACPCPCAPVVTARGLACVRVRVRVSVSVCTCGDCAWRTEYRSARPGGQTGRLATRLAPLQGPACGVCDFYLTQLQTFTGPLVRSSGAVMLPLLQFCTRCRSLIPPITPN